MKKCYNKVGKRFSRLTVISYTGKTTKHRSKIYLCRCDCGKEKEISSGVLRLKSGTKSCGCFSLEAKSRLSGNKNPYWKGYGDLPKRHWNQIVYSAIKRGLPIVLTIKQAWEIFLKQNKNCALSGLPLSIHSTGGHNARNGTASLDRIDSKKGYEEGNLQWVHKDINKMKQEFGESKFLDYCFQITKHQSSKTNPSLQ